MPAQLMRDFEAWKAAKGGQAPPTTVPTPAPTPQAGPVGGDGMVPDWVRTALLGGTAVGLIPTPVTAGIGMLSGAGLMGVSAIDAAEALGRGDYQSAGMEAMFAAIGGSGALRFFRRLRSAQPALAKAIAPLEKKAAHIAKLEKALKADTGASKETQQVALMKAKAQLVDASRRLFREQRLTGRELRLQGEKIPKELTASIRKAAKTSEGMAAREFPEAAPTLAKTIKKAKGQIAKQGEARLTRPDEVSRAEASVVGLLNRVNAPKEVIDQVKKSLATTKKLSKKQRKAYDQAGMAAGELLARMGAVGTGAAAGSIGGLKARPEDSERPPWQWAVAGAGAGALSGASLAHLALAPKGQFWRTAGDMNFFSLLSGPGTLAKSTIGSMSAAATGAAIRLAEGRPVQAAKILKAMTEPAAMKTWLQAFQDPLKFIPKAVLQKSKVPIKQGLMGVPTRVIAAGDAASSRALQLGGFTREEALRFNLSGDPRTALGQNFMRMVGSSVRVVNPRTGRATLKRGLFEGEKMQLLARYFLPFPRVATQLGEMMVEFSPATLASKSLQRAFGHSGMRETVAKAALGPLAAMGGAGMASITTPEVDPLGAAAFGPLAGWSTLGQNIYRSTVADRPVLSSLNQFAQDINPLVGEMFSFSDPLARPVPGLIRDVARAVDPAFNRETGPQAVVQAMGRQGVPMNPVEGLALGAVSKAQSRLPVLREGLPERPMPVDYAGRALYPDRPSFIPDTTLRGYGGQTALIDITLPKVLTSTPIQNPPILPQGDPTAQEVRRVQRAVPQMGEIVSPPAVLESPLLRDVSALQGQRLSPLPRDITRLAQRARGAPLQVMLGQTVNSPGYANMPDPVKSLLLRRIIQQTRGETGPGVGGLTNAAQMDPGSQDAIRQSLRTLIAGWEGALR